MALAEPQAQQARGRAAGPSAVPKRRQWPVGRLLILPALLYAIVVTQAPFFLTLYYSTFRWNLLRPELKGYVGLQNYRRILFEDNTFRDAVIVTAIFTIAAVAIALLLGLFYAELVNHRFPGRGVVRTMLITPFLVMPVAGALGWKNLMLDPDFGVVGWLLRSIHGSWSPVWLAHFPRQSIIAILVWRWAPFMMLILLAGMQSIDEEVREAARVDGASPLQEFVGITLPHLYRFLQLGALLGSVYIVQEVDAIFMTTQGGPSDLTTNLPYYVYETAIRGSNVGKGAALGVVVVALTIVVMTLLLRLLDRMLRGTYADS